MSRLWVLAALVVSQLAAAQSYPTKPIRLVVGLAPGGATDIMARTLTPALSDELGQPVVVDNRPGAAGSIGAAIVAKAPPDGYTLFLASSSFTSNAVLEKNSAYDPLRDFAPITNVASGPFLLVVRSSLPVNSVAELIAYAKANPGKLNALAVTSAKRSSVVPDFPTVAEAGVPGFETIGYFGLLAPANTPPAIVNTVHAAVQRAIRRRDFVDRVAADGAEPDGCTPAELRALLERDMKKTAEVLEGANVQRQ